MQRRDGSRDLDDRIRVVHMLEAAREAIEFVRDKKREDLDLDRILARAVAHCVQEIGEAAAKVAETSRARFPTVPWNKIIGMRHRLVHVYYDINTDTMWEVTQRDLPDLVAALSAELAAWPAANA